jgi:lipopolysaccharide/colanic/teichoic acid biosynthesis glycosyltransferase
MTNAALTGLNTRQRFVKRAFDLIISFTGLIMLWPIMLITAVLATIDTKANGFFLQSRVGMHGKLFKVIKIRTMRVDSNITTTVTQQNDARITALGAWFRRLKIDELPQLVNVLLGQMSLVGPRPDVPGFADRIEGNDRLLFLSIRPGITGPATLKFRKEEALLAEQDDPEAYNREVIFPEKVVINLAYIKEWSFYSDLKYIWETIVG